MQVQNLKGIILLTFVLLSLIVQTKNNDWENPDFFEGNKKKPHVTCMLFNRDEDVIIDAYSRSPFYQSLNGTWKFMYVDKHADRIKDFFNTGLNDAECTPPAMGDYKLVWADEFNKDGKPDTTAWRYEKGFVRNEEAQWYQEENAFCKNGLLVIEGKKELKPSPRYEEGSRDWRRSRRNIEYTSSSINTRDKRQWKYGRFVMRGRIDISSGLWPAWWTLGVDGRWPSNGEIDIMEYYKGKLLANIACGTATPNKAEWYSNTFAVDSMGGKAWASKFHTWRMDWDENAIALFVDDVLLNKTGLTKLVNKDGSGINPFKQPHYMLLNLAMGGMNGGEIDDTKFPNRFEVDYVRVYQKQ